MNNVENLAKLIRYNILTSTTEAGSGHPTSSLSATDLMAVLMFNGFFKADLENPQNPNNDRLIFSKGHASPLFYSLYAAAGKVSREELMSLRKFGSILEGHPTLEFKYTEVPTGSLGQGLSVGVGMALNAKLGKLSYNTFVLMGDSEVAEGSIWEAAAAASFYKLNNLVGILDVNRLGQSRETMLGHHVEVYQKRFEAFGWETVVIDGHNYDQIIESFKHINKTGEKPLIIIAKTLKGKGISFIEDKPGKHGVALKKDELELALKELGEVDLNLVGEVVKPEQLISESAPTFQSGLRPEGVGAVSHQSSGIKFTEYPTDKNVATRKAYGSALVNVFAAHPNIVVLDGETSNSTFAETFAKAHPDSYIESFIAEQNMAGMALGLSRRGKIPFISTFAAFFSRAFDQIRMSQFGDSNIKFVGSHAGVSIGEDGASQMGLEEIAMFRTLLGSVVLYPSDAVSTEKLVAEAAKHFGNVYIQTTRKDTPILYKADEKFPIGGSKVLKTSTKDVATVIGAGVTLHEALKAHEELQKENINIRVVDLYSIKPIDIEILKRVAIETKNIIVVEDHYAEGGIYDAVVGALGEVEGLPSYRLKSLAVKKMPRSGKPEELLAYEEIDSAAIIKKVKQLI